MPRVVYFTASTLNGFLADEAESLQWLFDVPGADAADDGIAEFMDTVGVLVMGASTYEWVVAHEHLLDRPEKWQEYYGDRPTWVFTTRELPAVPGADIRFASGAVGLSWPHIAAAAGDADVWLMGGGDLVGQFDDAGFLDEIVVTFAPAVVPSGKPLLPRRIESDRLTLRSVRKAGPFAELVYDVDRRMLERTRSGTEHARVSPEG